MCCCWTNRWPLSTRSCARKPQFELVNLQEKLGLTFMIVTHDQEEAMTVADRISVMAQGRVVQVGPPAEIYEAPKTRYVRISSAR
jgi:putrescine transport system ATP-binding protein